MRIAFADFSGWDFHVQSVDHLPLGGSHSAACYLARALAEQGHDVFFLSNVSVPGMYCGVKCLSWLTTSPENLRNLKLDAFVCLLAAGRGAMLRQVLGEQTRLVLWNQHAHDQDDVMPLHDARERAAYDGFVMVSQWQLRHFHQCFGIKPGRMVVLRNAIAPAFANLFAGQRSILEHKTSPPVLAYTSTPFRGLDWLLDAFPRIRRRVDGARLEIFSSMRVYHTAPADDEAQFGTLYRRCRATEGVEYIGSLPQRDLAMRMRGVTALVYPNTFAETSCIAALEAMAAGCRVVTSFHGALPETTSGFASLVPMSQAREAYLDQFVDETVALLRQGGQDRESADHLLRTQVEFVNQEANYALRAEQWSQWLESLPAVASAGGNGAAAAAAAAHQQPVTVEQAMQLGLDRHRAGRLAEAESFYRQALTQQPQHPEATHMLGILAHQAGKHEAAIELLRTAIALRPKFVEAYNSLGTVLNHLGRIDEALACYDQALAIDPDYAPAHNNRSIVFRRRSQLAAAPVPKSP